MNLDKLIIKMESDLIALKWARDLTRKYVNGESNGINMVQEKVSIEVLLKSLCDSIEQSTSKSGLGRNPTPLCDVIFAAVMKVYSTLSGRCATMDIRDFEKRGYISKTPHYNSLFRTIEDPATTRILTHLIEESSAPIAEIENLAWRLAPDSVGTIIYDRWFNQKYGKPMTQYPWIKLNIMIGMVTNVVMGVKVSRFHHCPVLPKKNFEAIDAFSVIPFKNNSIGMVSKSAHWKRMWCHFFLKSEDVLKHYHRRSNVESAMLMIQSKFGGAVRSKLLTAQVNEVLAKVLCHNLACIVHAITEFGIEASFS
jgi:hypothetical protein